MATVELFRSHSHIDLENGGAAAVHRRRRSINAAVGEYDAQEEEEEGSLCFSDAEEEENDNHSTYSSYSQFYSTTGGSIYGFSSAGRGGSGGTGAWSSRRISSASELAVAVEATPAVEIKVHLGKVERICRICHLSLLEESGGSEEFGVPIDLGCSCKDDLGTAHKHCAETWFKIKGNKICEICNCTACNMLGPNENADSTHHPNENANSAGEPSVAPTAPEPQRFWQGNRFLNFLLACMVFAFVISWLFHFKVPS